MLTRGFSNYLPSFLFLVFFLVFFLNKPPFSNLFLVFLPDGNMNYIQRILACQVTEKVLSENPSQPETTFKITQESHFQSHLNDMCTNKKEQIGFL